MFKRVSQRDLARGVQFGSAFFVVFLLLGYDALLSLLLAAVGGTAGGAIASGWGDRKTPPGRTSILPDESFSRFGTVEPPHHVSDLAKRQAQYRRRQTLHRGRQVSWWDRLSDRLTDVLSSSDSDVENGSNEEDFWAADEADETQGDRS